MIEHAAVVEKLAAGRITVAVDTDGCSSCGHGSSCGMSKLARQATGTTMMEFDAPPDIKVGDHVVLLLPESRMTAYALLGYLLPAIALLVGAGVGAHIDGTDGGTALGAIIGFLGAIVFARIMASFLPSMIPQPEIVPADNFVPLSHVLTQESYHER